MTIEIKVRGNLGQSFKLNPVMGKNQAKPSLVLNFSIASRQFKRKEDGSGFEPVGNPEWVDCEYWNRNAEHLYRILQKGMPVVAIGEERIECYQNRDGIEVRVRKLRVDELYIIPNERVEHVMLKKRIHASEQNDVNVHEADAINAASSAEEKIKLDDSDIPF